MLLVNRVYDITETFPKSQMFSLAQQMQRCAISIPSNIAEGSARGSKKEYVQFLYIARGSLAELDTQLIIARERNFILNTTYEDTFQLASDVGRMLTKLIYSLK